jgi:hypothetical protein
MAFWANLGFSAVGRRVQQLSHLFWGPVAASLIRTRNPRYVSGSNDCTGSAGVACP